MTKIHVLFILVVLMCFRLDRLNSQRLDHKQGELILCLHPNSNRNSISQRHAVLDKKLTGFELSKCLSADLGIWKATFDYQQIDEKKLLAQLNSDREVVIAQLNHFIKRRSIIPNDPMLHEQWQWINTGERGLADADIDAEEAWSLSTGGVSQLGDTIVVALIDVGVYYQHEDLNQNIWMNKHEIPDNGIDDDENGYIDDVRGWNVLEGNDNIEPETFGGGVQETHGTEILGVVGAVGNNQLGIAGLNWNVKMMNVFFNSDLNEADVIAAYGYVLAQRKLYNETGGQKGAFVVATNLSYGDEDLDPDDTPIWCAVYDSLGKEGILSCTATANTSINIDSIKDVPTSCASDYMISVTATNQSDERSFAAYGKNDIDLAAPGSQIFTTGIPGYDFVTGTSYASPMVAAAIALLYASPCGDLASLARRDPAGAAMHARSLILDEVDQISSLSQEIASGGRLNLFKSLSRTMAECQSCIAPFEVVVGMIDNDATKLEIAWDQADSVTSVNFNWRLSGDTAWAVTSNVVSPLQLEALSLCTSYEFFLESTCQDGTKAATAIGNFKTEGCCMPPSNILTQAESDSTIRVTWTGSSFDAGYFLLYSIQDSLDWDTLVLTEGNDQVTISDLLSCTSYQLVIQTICQGTEGIMSSDTLTMRTLGCGTCLDSLYCELSVNAVGDEWIQNVTLNTINVSSGFDGGYGDYTGNSTQLKQGNDYTLKIQPGFASDTLDEYYFAWIDFDQNGIFDEDEEIFGSDTAISKELETKITIPQDARLGSTRLRVMMLFDPIEDSVSGCNTNIDLGEAEDYCVEIIIDSLLCPKPTNLDTLDFQGTSTLIVWEVVDSALAYIIRHRKVGEDEWMEVVDTTNMFEMSELEECQTYEVQVQAVCGRDTSGYTESLLFASFCSTSTDEFVLNLTTRIFPNPFDRHLSMLIESQESLDAEIQILQLNGQVMQQRKLQIYPGEQMISLSEASSLPPGMYLITLQTKDGKLVRKILRQ